MEAIGALFRICFHARLAEEWRATAIRAHIPV